MTLLCRLLPDLAAVSRRSQRAVAGATGLMFALLAVNIAHTPVSYTHLTLPTTPYV